MKSMVFCFDFFKNKLLTLNKMFNIKNLMNKCGIFVVYQKYMQKLKSFARNSNLHSWQR